MRLFENMIILFSCINHYIPANIINGTPKVFYVYNVTGNLVEQ